MEKMSTVRVHFHQIPIFPGRNLEMFFSFLPSFTSEHLRSANDGRAPRQFNGTPDVCVTICVSARSSPSLEANGWVGETPLTSHSSHSTAHRQISDAVAPRAAQGRPPSAPAKGGSRGSCRRSRICGREPARRLGDAGGRPLRRARRDGRERQIAQGGRRVGTSHFRVSSRSLDRVASMRSLDRLIYSRVLTLGGGGRGALVEGGGARARVSYGCVGTYSLREEGARATR